ncbi:MAG: HAD-IA family hydrolase [Bryobacteraceae bacterium]|jgi:HAD superfamily phosphatase
MVKPLLKAGSPPAPAIIVFDMDGVLVDVSESYRETIVRTVQHFTGRTIERAVIQRYKNQGGWNNDWELSQRICADLGVSVEYNTVVEYFNHLFLDQGLIHRERWLPGPGLLEGLASRYELAIFTGRNMLEVGITLEREGWQGRFLIVCTDDVVKTKPDPEGLLRIMGRRPGKELLYIGDTVDDARSARAAGVAFFGIAAGDGDLAHLLEREGALAVLADINELEDLLCVALP